MCYWPFSRTRCLQCQCLKSLLTTVKPTFFSCSPREKRREEGDRGRERPIKMPPSFSLHSSLVSPHEFIWWQTIPTPPPVCAHTHTHSCISSIKNDSQGGTPWMTFLKMRDDASQKLPSMMRVCRCLCFLIYPSRFSFLLSHWSWHWDVSDCRLQISPHRLPPFSSSLSSSCTHLSSSTKSLITISCIFVFFP